MYRLTSKVFADRLFRARTGAGIRTGVEAAEILNIHPSAYHKLESGEQMPGLDRIFDIVDKLGLDPRILVPEWFGDAVDVLPSPSKPEAKRKAGRPRK